jgi:hypothetical protein
MASLNGIFLEFIASTVWKNSLMSGLERATQMSGTVSRRQDLFGAAGSATGLLSRHFRLLQQKEKKFKAEVSKKAPCVLKKRTDILSALFAAFGQRIAATSSATTAGLK